MPVGWKLEERCRAALLLRFPPRYPRVIADHVTLNLQDRVPPPPVGAAQVIGRCDDDAGVEALVVRIDGSTARPDGLVWHVTWSLADGRATGKQRSHRHARLVVRRTLSARAGPRALVER
ncbi:hypothetical protein [Novosphingobium sp. EMRT-2]|uniref:hypothetical protein n=1 Tax=Novosphingobium sp. EMRT-2 TaxID=2571749 RepID=UPI0021021C5A|nr:hypothetical protein [Novosphingobium sp. EMRT-2]